MAHILNAAAFRNGRDKFEDELVFALTIPVVRNRRENIPSYALLANDWRQILESMINPKVRLNAWILKQAETFGPPKPLRTMKPKNADDENFRLSTLELSSLARIPDFIRYPELHLFEIQLTYEQKRIDILKMRQRLAKTGELPPAHEIGTFSPQVSPAAMVYLYHTAYALLLALALILNGLLRALDPSDITLAEESITFANEIVVIAEQMSQYRPLGAGYIPICLIAAWAATADLSKQSQMEAIIADYQEDFAGARWMEGAVWLRNRFEILQLKTLAAQLEQQHRSVFDKTATPGDGSVDTIDLSRSCCIQ